MNKSHSFKFGPGLPIAALPESKMRFSVAFVLSFFNEGTVGSRFLSPVRSLNRLKCELQSTRNLGPYAHNP